MAIPRNINPSRVNDLAWAAFCTMSSAFVDIVSVASGNASTLWLTQTSWRNIGHCLEVYAVGMVDVKFGPGLFSSFNTCPEASDGLRESSHGVKVGGKDLRSRARCRGAPQIDMVHDSPPLDLTDPAQHQGGIAVA